MSRPVNRIEPLLPVGAYRTYSIAAPLASHWRSATCAEVDCGAYLHGWSTTVDETADLGAMQAHYIRYNAGRAFAESRTETGLTCFAFEAGQRCFAAAAHRVRVDRVEHYLVRDGDWRGNPTGVTYRHAGPGDWVDDFATHQDRLATRLGRG